jgi:hypothetical protein
MCALEYERTPVREPIRYDAGQIKAPFAAGVGAWAISANSCGAVASASVSPSGGAPPHGEPRAVTPIVARKEDYQQRRIVIRWEHCYSVYRSRFAFAVMLLCVR